MTKRISAKELMNELLNSSNHSAMSMREQFLLRETLYSLARMIKSEHMLEVRQSVKKLVPDSWQPVHIRRDKRKSGKALDYPGQAQLVWGYE